MDKVFGIKLDPIEVAQQNHDGILDKKAIAKMLIKMGYASNTKEVYDKYIGAKAPAYVPIEKITAKQAIDLIHSCGGVVAWAHPATAKKTHTSRDQEQFSDEELLTLLKTLKELGLDGVECFTTKTTPEESRKFIQWAKDLDLLVTGGSDFHNHIIGEQIGMPSMTMEHVNKLTEAIRLRNAAWRKSDSSLFLNNCHSGVYNTSHMPI